MRTQIQELFPHWEIVRYLLNRVPWPYPKDGALQFVRDVALPAVQRGGPVGLDAAAQERAGKVIGVLNLAEG